MMLPGYNPLESSGYTPILNTNNKFKISNQSEVKSNSTINTNAEKEPPSLLKPLVVISSIFLMYDFLN